MTLPSWLIAPAIFALWAILSFLPAILMGRLFRFNESEPARTSLMRALDDYEDAA